MKPATTPRERAARLFALRNCDCSPTCDALRSPKVTPDVVADAIAAAVADARAECAALAEELAAQVDAGSSKPAVVAYVRFVAHQIAGLGDAVPER